MLELSLYSVLILSLAGSRYSDGHISQVITQDCFLPCGFYGDSSDIVYTNNKSIFVA